MILPIRRPSRALLKVVATLSTTLAVGCGSVEDPGSANFTTVPARGKVSAKGKPITEGIIVLVPLPDGGSTQQASAEIQGDGSFELVSPGSKEGAMPGKYRVEIESPKFKRAPKSEPVVAQVEDGKDLDIQVP